MLASPTTEHQAIYGIDHALALANRGGHMHIVALHSEEAAEAHRRLDPDSPCIALIGPPDPAIDLSALMGHTIYLLPAASDESIRYMFGSDDEGASAKGGWIAILLNASAYVALVNPRALPPGPRTDSDDAMMPGDGWSIVDAALAGWDFARFAAFASRRCTLVNPPRNVSAEIPSNVVPFPREGWFPVFAPPQTAEDAAAAEPTAAVARAIAAIWATPQSDPPGKADKPDPARAARAALGGADRYVLQKDHDTIKSAARVQATAILAKVGVNWTGGAAKIRCPYGTHPDHNPSWRWNDKEGKAFCSCESGLNIFNVVSKVTGRPYGEAVVFVAEFLGRDDLIKTKRSGKPGSGQKQDIDSLLAAPSAKRNDDLPSIYLGSRLGIDPNQVPRPRTRAVGIKALEYFDHTKKGKLELVATAPCAVFETVDRDGKRHGHRIYLSPDGKSKADLGESGGKKRDPKKSTTKKTDESIAGRSVIWGDAEAAPEAIIGEGIETMAAVALAFSAEIEAGKVAVFACIFDNGVKNFKPYPATVRVKVAGDRDETSKDGKPPTRAGEKAAREFGIRNHDSVAVDIALPGNAGDKIDWLEVLLSGGADAVRAGIVAAAPFEPNEDELEGDRTGHRVNKEIDETAAAYPLPQMDAIKLQYARTESGKIWVHRLVGEKTDKETGETEQELEAICSPFGVPARLRMVDAADAYGLRVVVKDMNGELRQIDLERGSLAKMGASAIRERLLANGLLTERDGNAIVTLALMAADPHDEIVTVSRAGWHQLEGLADPIFTAPSGDVLGAPSNFKAELSINCRLSKTSANRGTLSGWQRGISVAVRQDNCLHWTIGGLAGFAGPILGIADLDSCGVNLSGFSSSGKTIAQKLAASVWSTPDPRHNGLLRSFNSTKNATEGLAQAASGSVLALDEMGLMDGEEVGSIIYGIAGGVGKQRLDVDANMKQARAWTTFAIFSGEHSLAQKVRDGGGTWQTGMAVRFPDIDVSGINRAVKQSEIDAIKTGIAENYGHAGPAFVQALIDDGLHRDPGEIQKLIQTTARKLAGDAAEGAKLRAAIPFAVLGVAGLLARKYEILPRETPVDAAVKWAWRKFSESLDAEALDPAEQVISSLQTFVASKWDMTIKSTSLGKQDRDTNRDAEGWHDDRAVYIPTTLIVKASGGNLKAEDVGQILSKRGLLIKSDADRLSIKYVPNVGHVNCYALTRQVFGRQGDFPRAVGGNQ